ncbi:hypothetical protein [Candidatus Nephthysia bennettiae]|uniref:Uncharacterized protein n=1 Tax=Candidatus Nephthysia bennettiae TaxID=3127016 RepID=A0A934K4U4_9BACT|nr:hypothetical protein [Candidatus Dormibacteraeota bacterium]MBJ7612726.1 hypothetical protein [Candidatus Dormibacteraeota bacterium]
MLLAGVVLAVSLLAVAARLLARSRLNRARAIGSEEIWQALARPRTGVPRWLPSRPPRARPATPLRDRR